MAERQVDALLRRYALEHDAQLQEQLLAAFRPLVAYLAGKLPHPSGSPEALTQAGDAGLAEALERYDIESGVKFSTFAAPIILTHLRRV